MTQVLRWLHISDFHQGVSGQDQDWLWPQVRPWFYRDLKQMSQKLGGPFDLLFFTGDLTQSAQPQQFADLNVMLNDLLAQMKDLGPEPVLLEVPGNHDLLRPSAATPPLPP